MRFQYEIAEKILDRFVIDRQTDAPRFLWAWGRLKCAIIGIAAVDYWDLSEEDALARAWEDADVAFRGFGDELMSGGLVQLWAALPKGHEAAFRDTIKDAFRKAHRRTKNPDHNHAAVHRLAPIRDLESGFCGVKAMPLYGPALRHFAESNGVRLELLIAVARMAKKARDLFEKSLKERSLKKTEPDPSPPRGSHLRVVK